MPQRFKEIELLFSFLIELVFVGIWIRQSGGSLSSNTQVCTSREMLRDSITGSLLDYGPQANFMAKLRPCFVKIFFFFLGKAGCRGFKTSMLNAEIVYICGDFQIFPRYLSLPGVMVCRVLLNLLDAHQNYLGRLLKIQILGPHPRRLWISK